MGTVEEGEYKKWSRDGNGFLKKEWRGIREIDCKNSCLRVCTLASSGGVIVPF